ncbi:hypothetical protein D3Z09_10625 [Rahnella aquatilis]|nr:hypothetical protein D3Z09_10625 [Rahnella aquatilis]
MPVLRYFTLSLWNRTFVGFACSPGSLNCVSSSGIIHLPPCCNSNDSGNAQVNESFFQRSRKKDLPPEIQQPLCQLAKPLGKRQSRWFENCLYSVGRATVQAKSFIYL